MAHYITLHYLDGFACALVGVKNSLGTDKAVLGFGSQCVRSYTLMLIHPPIWRLFDYFLYYLMMGLSLVFLLSIDHFGFKAFNIFLSDVYLSYWLLWQIEKLIKLGQIETSIPFSTVLCFQSSERFWGSFLYSAALNSGYLSDFDQIHGGKEERECVGLVSVRAPLDVYFA